MNIGDNPLVTKISLKKSPKISLKNKLNSSILHDYIIPCIIGVIIGLFVNQFFSITNVKGLSMHPTLNNNDILIMNKIPKYNKTIKHGDIVIFNASPFEHNKSQKVYYIKRIIGMPGDKVVITNGGVYLNDSVLEEPYLENIKTDGNINIIVPDNSYFVLGDNRGGSADSRIFGVISHEDVVGIAIFRLWPIWKFKLN
ncbi:MAG: signal peptidase I [Romboutsia sp.]|nr:signal peptidase I [Romboutsia sp.]